MSRPEFDLSVYLVTDTAQCGGPDEVVETVRHAIAGGVTLVQFRDHDLSDDEFVALGRRVREICVSGGVPLIIDDRVHLVAEIGADGVHVGQSDMPVDQARAILGDDLLIGFFAPTPPPPMWRPPCPRGVTSSTIWELAPCTALEPNLRLGSSAWLGCAMSSTPAHGRCASSVG